LYADIVFPLQKVFIKQLKNQLCILKNNNDEALSKIQKEDIDKISFEEVDLKD
jgi:hypothetical protein